MENVLEHKNYKNTGLSKDAGECKDVADYIKNQNKTAEEEDTKLTEEQDEVTVLFAWIESHPCDCVWEEWQGWTECSKTCGGGIQRQERNVAKPAKNDGAECTGPDHMEKACNEDGCREYI